MAVVRRLKNGAFVLSKFRRKDGSFVYLCFNGGVQPYVTWLAPKHDEQATWAGHYFDNFSDALEKYESRCS